MAVAPWASKALIIGIGGVSVVGVGGIVIKQGYLSKENKSSVATENSPAEENINYLEKLNLPAACDSTSKSCVLTKDDLNKLQFIFDSSIKGKPQISSDCEADLTWKTVGESEDTTYEFTIKAKTNEIDLGDSLSNIKIPTSHGMKFGIGVETNSDGQKKYYLRLDLSSKELSAGMSCKGGNCTKSEGVENINGLSSYHSIAQGITEDIKRYSGWYRYAVKINSSAENEADGYYKLEFDSSSKKWKLAKVDDLLSKWDESILDEGTWDANKEGGSNNKLKVTVTETDATINGTDKQPWTWECEITLNNIPGVTNVDNQLNNLKTKLGITGGNQSTTDFQRRKFVENCARNRDESKKITDETLKGSPNKLESSFTIKNEDFEKLFTEKVTKTS